MIAESSDRTNLAQMIAYVPITWAVGGTIGPLVGGLLSHPAEHFPWAFGDGFWRTHPYLLPCIVSAIFSAVCWLVAYAFLKETVRSPVSFSYLFRIEKKSPRSENVHMAVESPQDPIPESERPKPLRELLSHKVLITATNYGLLSLIDIALRTLQPLIYSTPIVMGGLGLPPSSIGKVLSASAFLNGIVQMFFFAKVHRYLGSKGTFIAGLAATLPVIFAFPALSYVARTQGSGPLLWSVISFQVFFIPGISFSYGTALSFTSKGAWAYGVSHRFSLGPNLNRHAQ
ncbi:hypothetical protein H0H87_010925 [Tephrocybe sp. NHM501043]|nr:hypothetical protein H0H87_010925 [Tephrocybe sp. NHM501043]